MRIMEDPLNLRVNDEPSNIKEGYLVGLTDETLANMFAVSDDLCGSKFELKVNDVRFVGNPVSLEPSKDETGQWTSTITMFHIVFALKATAAYSIVQCYHELSQRIGLILAHEEKRMGYVSIQTKCLISAMDEVFHLPEDQQEHLFSLAVERSQLAKDIQTIYHHICSKGEIRLYMNKWIELSFCLPHKVYRLTFPNSSVEPETIFQCLEELRPYHTILFLVKENELLDTLSTDASPALRRLIRQSSPLKSFRTLSVDTDLSLTQVFQLTGHLLYWGKVTVIYPICESNIYVLSSKLPTPIPKLLQAKFEDTFPGENLTETLASFSLPSRLQVPPPMALHQTRITEMIIWLLKKRLISQLHTYVTLALTANMAWSYREEEKREEQEQTLVLPLNLDPTKQGFSSMTSSYIEQSQAGSEAGSYASDRLGGGSVASEPRSERVEGEGKEGGKDVLENILEESKTKEKRREQILREFTPEEREVLLAVPAADNIEDLARFVHLSRYFRGQHHLEEIMYLENIRRSTLLHLLDKFRDLVIKTEHEDPVIHSSGQRAS